MRARLTRLTCLSPGLAGLACPPCRSFGWPPRAPRDPCMLHRGHKTKAAREPMAIHSCVHLLWVHPLRTTSSNCFYPSLLPSFHPLCFSFSSSTASSSSSCCTQTTRDREGEKKQQVNLNFQHCTHSECQSCSLISEKSGVRILASSPSW